MLRTWREHVGACMTFASPKCVLAHLEMPSYDGEGAIARKMGLPWPLLGNYLSMENATAKAGEVAFWTCQV